MVEVLRYVGGKNVSVEVPDTFEPCSNFRLRDLSIVDYVVSIMITAKEGFGSVGINIRTYDSKIDFEYELSNNSLVLDKADSSSNAMLCYNCSPQYAYALSVDSNLLKQFLSGVDFVCWQACINSVHVNGLDTDNVHVGYVSGIGRLVKTSKGYDWDLPCMLISIKDEVDSFLARWSMVAPDNKVKLMTLADGLDVFMESDSSTGSYTFNLMVKVEPKVRMSCAGSVKYGTMLNVSSMSITPAVANAIMVDKSLVKYFFSPDFKVDVGNGLVSVRYLI